MGLKFLFNQKVKIKDIINTSQGGLNVLHQICKNPELENAALTIKFLMKLGFDIHAKTTKTEDTPIHIACSHCNKSVMLALLDHDKNLIFAQNKTHRTPLHSLMVGYDKKYKSNQIAMTSVLFEQFNAEQVVKEVDIHGKSALHVACMGNFCPKEVIQILLEHGALTNMVDDDEYYPKDYVKERKQPRNDTLIILKMLNHENMQQKETKNMQNIRTLSKYLELSENTATKTKTPQSPQTATKSKEDAEAQRQRIYGDDSDEEEKNENGDKNILITPLDPNHATTLDQNEQNDALQIVEQQQNIQQNDEDDNDEVFVV